MSLILNQLLILLWKSCITRLRHFISTIFELFTPLVLALFLAYMYMKANETTESYTKEFDQRYGKPTELAPTPDPSKRIPATIFGDPRIHMADFDSGQLYFKATIFYGPENNETNELMKTVANYAIKDMIKLKPLATNELVNYEIESKVTEDQNDPEFHQYYGVIFDTNALSGDRLRYTIRTIGNLVSLVNRLYPQKFKPGPAPDILPYSQTFCQLQILINNAFVEKMAVKKNKPLKIKSFSAYRFPYPPYDSPKQGNDYFSIQDFIALTIAIGYVVLCPLIVKRITDEKVAKAKELMRMIGMSDWVFWLSHFISYFIIMVFHAVVFTYLYCVGFGGHPIVQHSNPLLFFTIMVIYSAQSILFCMTLTTVFNRPVMAVVVTVILWMISYAVPFYLLNPAIHRDMDILGSNKYRIMSAFLPNMGLSWAFAIIGQFELLGTGARLPSLYKETSLYGSMTLGFILSTMLMSCGLYMILIWYIDNVWPFQYGVPKPVWFPFSMTYWCPSKYKDSKQRAETPKSDLVVDTRNFEKEPDTPIAIIIKNLKKVFGGYGFQRKTAVDNLSLNIYENQITALLGHNGAGKSTTMNMITGIYPPTSGKILVNGYDIEFATSEARRSIGLCPQENVIFTELTVGQHLKLFAILKGFDWNSVGEEVNNSLRLLKLTDKTNELAVNLSGGMKRKLMLGIAMVGGTRILILDEPTSGLDPEARRLVWDLLQNLSKERTILLTTHYMEEADVLGDRIAIMSEGKIKCCGSSMFLKKRFGAGYHLTVCKTIGFRTGLMEETLKKYSPNAHIHSEIQTEVVYALESSEDEDKQNMTSIFPQLFDEIEKNKDKLGISSCGLSITTMEDVFIRVGNELEGTDEEHNHNRKLKDQSTDPLVNKKPEYMSGFQLSVLQFYALFMKRFHFARRYWPMTIFQLILPGLMFVVALLTDNAIRSNGAMNSKNLSLDLKELYGNTYGFSKTTAQNQLEDSYVKNSLFHGMQTSRIGKIDPNDWALNHSIDLDEYSKQYLIGSVFDEEYNAEVWYNNEALHSLPIAINLFFESILKYFWPEREGEQLLTVSNYPVNYNYDQINLGGLIGGWIVTCLILFPITVPFIGASYVLVPISERISKAKLLQLMTGLSSVLFWFTNFVFDLINHSIVVIIIYGLFAIFDFNGIFFSQTNTAIGLFLMLFLYGFASIPLAYCFSLVLGKPSTGYAVLVIIYLLFGVIAVVIMSTLDVVKLMTQNAVMDSNNIKVVLSLFRMVPVFSMSFGLQRLYRIGSLAKACTDFEEKNKGFLNQFCQNVEKENILYGCCTDKCSATGDCFTSKNPLAMDDTGAGMDFAFLIGSGLFYIVLLLVFELHWMRKVSYQLRGYVKSFKTKSVAESCLNDGVSSNEDPDVIAEKNRIESLQERGKFSEEAMAVIHLSKDFGSFRAVDDLSFGLHKEECFGLLGVNGAGKTTTFGMLTGDLMLSNGNAFIDKYSLREDLKSFQKQIGYCPQFDALLDKLTGKEMLYLFARLRGIPSNIIDKEVMSLIDMVDLQKHAFKCTDTYSGGNRRKLSLALAIIGCPQVIFLDEPTAGVDPAARRKIWSTLVYIQNRYESAIVLTSHSMEECEALCSRIAIMVNGRFKCLGPTQHLRKKFGQGFTIIVKMSRDQCADKDYMQRVQQFIQSSIPSAVLKDSHHGLLHFHITDTSVQWSYMFSVMERAKHELQLEDYLVSDTTLEQIFLNFAKTQR